MKEGCSICSTNVSIIDVKNVEIKIKNVKNVKNVTRIKKNVCKR